MRLQIVSDESMLPKSKLIRFNLENRRLRLYPSGKFFARSHTFPFLIYLKITSLITRIELRQIIQKKIYMLSITNKTVLIQTQKGIIGILKKKDGEQKSC